MIDDLMTTAKVAAWLQRKPSGVLRLVHHEGLPVIRLSARSLLFSRKAVQAWLDSRMEVNGTPEQVTPRKPVLRAGDCGLGWDGKDRMKPVKVWS